MDKALRKQIQKLAASVGYVAQNVPSLDIDKDRLDASKQLRDRMTRVTPKSSIPRKLLPSAEYMAANPHWLAGAGESLMSSKKLGEFGQNRLNQLTDRIKQMRPDAGADLRKQQANQQNSVPETQQPYQWDLDDESSVASTDGQHFGELPA